MELFNIDIIVKCEGRAKFFAPGIMWVSSIETVC